MDAGGKLRETWSAVSERHAVAGAQALTYERLLTGVDTWRSTLERSGVGAGEVVAICGDFSPESICALFASIELRAIVVPLAPSTLDRHPEFVEIAEVGTIVRMTTEDRSSRVEKFERRARHPLYAQLAERDAAGIVLFSSGSTGAAKATVLDAHRLLARFEQAKDPHRIMSFLLFDHIGGLNTLFATLATGGTLVVPSSRDVDGVCATVAEWKVEVLPTSPTFLRMLLMSGAHERYDLSSLRLITYGTEPMHEATLRALHAAFPGVRLKQTYGLTELGIFSTKSKADDSLWVKVGGEGVETKIVDGVLWVRAKTAMLGYLNADAPIDADGWYDTGDVVEASEDGWLLIRGRSSEIINVGGEKVHPAEVENVLMQLENVVDATVRGRRSAVTGQVVTATVVLATPDDPAKVAARARALCAERLAPYKVPVLVQVSTERDLGERFKKMRRAEAGS